MELQTEKAVEFNYFYIKFLQDLPRIKAKKAMTRIGQDQRDIEDLYEFVYMEQLPQKEELEIYTQDLWNICSDYIVLADAKIDVIPGDLFEFIDLILETMEETPYSESFLFSLNCIYKEYLNCLKMGSPILYAYQDEKQGTSLEITVDSNHQIVKMEAFNMSLLEEDKIMNQLVSTAIKKQSKSISDLEKYKPSKVIIKQQERKY